MGKIKEAISGWGQKQMIFGLNKTEKISLAALKTIQKVEEEFKDKPLGNTILSIFNSFQKEIK